MLWRQAASAALATRRAYHIYLSCQVTVQQGNEMYKKPDVTLMGKASKGVDDACDYDRVFFETHPGVDKYYRAPMPLEFSPMEEPAPAKEGFVLAVMVTQIEPGVRYRLLGEMPEKEALRGT
jgi:hypothetical protein